MTVSFDLDWDLQPLGGETGQSYKGVKDNQKIFLKRNTTPFLAAVSVEGIAPKLLWTKRTAHGEGITAQEWLDARELRPEEMVQLDVLNMVKDIHHSSNLKSMLAKIQGDPILPKDFLREYQEGLQHDLANNVFLNEVYAYLESQAEDIKESEKTVCHGDLNHKNFLLDAQNRLYVVDWEMVRFADPLSDIAGILVQYIDRRDWLVWLQVYGYELDAYVLKRLEWYCIYACLVNIKRCHFQGRYHQMNNSIMIIKKLMTSEKLEWPY